MIPGKIKVEIVNLHVVCGCRLYYGLLYYHSSRDQQCDLPGNLVYLRYYAAMTSQSSSRSTDGPIVRCCGQADGDSFSKRLLRL